jgi:hypothetical protein
VPADIRPAEVIRDDQEDVGPLGGEEGRRDESAQRCEEQAFHGIDRAETYFRGDAR